MKRLASAALIGGLLFPVSAMLAMTGSTASATKLPSAQKFSVTMTDISYSVKTITVKKGVPVTFTFANKGRVVHEAVVGTRAHQVAHDKEMAAMGGMVMADEPTAIALKPGVTKKLNVTFDKAGRYEVACHTPGHYSAGMKINVVVV